MREVVKVELHPAAGLAVYEARITNQDGSYRLVTRVDRKLLGGFRNTETVAYFHAERDDEAIALYRRAPQQPW